MHDRPSGGRLLYSRTGIALLPLLAIAGSFLLTEHTTHVFGALPFLLLLACPLLHAFMHGGHGAHDAAGDRHAGPVHGQTPGRTQP